MNFLMRLIDTVCALATSGDAALTMLFASPLHALIALFRFHALIYHIAAHCAAVLRRLALPHAPAAATYTGRHR